MPSNVEGLSIKIKTKELTKLTNLIEELDNRVKLSDVSFRTSLSKEFGKIVSEDVRDRFAASPSTTAGGRVPPGIQWRALSDSYLRNRPDRIQGRVLIDSSTLMNSFQTDSPMFVNRFNNQYSWEVGTTVGYSTKLQETWPFLVMHEALVKDLATAYLKWLVNKFEDQFSQ